MFGRKTDPQVDVVEKRKRSWSSRRKLVVSVVVLIVIIALAVGLGVGLSRKGGDDDDSDDGNDNDDDLPGEGPSRDEAWKPKAGLSWQIILNRPMDLSSDDDVTPDVEVYDIDHYDNSPETIATLQSAGKKVICYFSAGSWENWRDDKDDFDEADLGKELDGWPDERWVNISSPAIRDIMKERIRHAWVSGCDAIDPDNVDGFQNDNGLGLTSNDAVDFMRFLSAEAQSYKMAIGLKNAGDIIPDVIDFIDFSVNEQCVEYSECETFAAFTEAGKPVFNIEYPAGAPDNIQPQTSEEICSHQGNSTGTDDFSTVIKNMILDGWVEYCDGETFETQTIK